MESSPPRPARVAVLTSWVFRDKNESPRSRLGFRLSRSLQPRGSMRWMFANAVCRDGVAFLTRMRDLYPDISDRQAHRRRRKREWWAMRRSCGWPFLLDSDEENGCGDADRENKSERVHRVTVYCTSVSSIGCPRAIVPCSWNVACFVDIGPFPKQTRG